jgi:hypothetical protein
LENSHSFKNVLTSIALISPNIINHIFGTHRDYINGSYWFLWPTILLYSQCPLFFQQETFCSQLCFFVHFHTCIILCDKSNHRQYFFNKPIAPPS